MNNVQDIRNVIREILTEEEIKQINQFNRLKDDDKRLISLRSVIFGSWQQSDIYIRVNSLVDPSWLVYKIYTLGKNYEF